MADFTVPDYNDANRAFLQAFMARNSLTLEAARPILAAILTVREGKDVTIDDVGIEDLRSFISKANAALSPLDLEIRSTFNQVTRERVYALVNTTSDPLMQLATTYTADEIEYIKKLLDAMFDGPNNRGKKEAMCISGMDAMQLVKRRDTQDRNTQGKAPALSMHDAEDLLSRLMQEGWLATSKNGFYSLTPRALMELRGWLVEMYNDPADEDEEEARSDKIKFCHACKEIITVGQRCARRECPFRLHDICTANFFRMQRSEACPICQTAWDGEHYVGEKAITTSDGYSKSRRKSSNRASQAAPMDEADD